MDYIVSYAVLIAIFCSGITTRTNLVTKNPASLSLIGPLILLTPVPNEITLAALLGVNVAIEFALEVIWYYEHPMSMVR